MTGLREAARAVCTARSIRLPLPAQSSTAKAAMRIAPGLGPDKPRAALDYNQIARSISDGIEAGRPLTEREARDAAWCLWATTPALAKRSPCLEAILEELGDCKRQRTFRSLASSFMASFAVDMPAGEEVSAVLRRLASRFGGPYCRLHDNYGIFDRLRGPQNVANASITGKVSPTEVLKHAGLTGLDAQSGFAKACSEAAFATLAGGANIDPLGRLALVRTMALDTSGRLIFDDHGPIAVRALLKPLDGQVPARTVRDAFLSFMLSLFEDPRLKPGRWSRMPDARDTVRKWLTELTLRQFLGVVDGVAEQDMWRHRRAFWEAVYNQDLISEAWVVFGKRGAAAAQRAFGKQIPFGQFVGGGRKPVQPGHAVLLLRIGRGVVADWSHDGKCNIWNEANAPGAPRLYDPTYTSDHVHIEADVGSGPDDQLFSTRHVGSTTYTWQSRVAAKIFSMTRVRIPQSSYQVP